MASVTLALIVVAVVALAVPSTRWLGVLALALLVVLHPVPFVLLLPLAVGAYMYLRFWSDR